MATTSAHHGHVRGMTGMQGVSVSSRKSNYLTTAKSATGGATGDRPLPGHLGDEAKRPYSLQPEASVLTSHPKQQSKQASALLPQIVEKAEPPSGSDGEAEGDAHTGIVVAAPVVVTQVAAPIAAAPTSTAAQPAQRQLQQPTAQVVVTTIPLYLLHEAIDHEGMVHVFRCEVLQEDEDDGASTMQPSAKPTSHVYLHGSFDGWRRYIPMQLSPDGTCFEVALPIMSQAQAEAAAEAVATAIAAKHPLSTAAAIVRTGIKEAKPSHADVCALKPGEECRYRFSIDGRMTEGMERDTTDASCV